MLVNKIHLQVIDRSKEYIESYKLALPQGVDEDDILSRDSLAWDHARDSLRMPISRFVSNTRTITMRCINDDMFKGIKPEVRSSVLGSLCV